jgi:hypothetical protein
MDQLPTDNLSVSRKATGNRSCLLNNVPTRGFTISLSPGERQQIVRRYQLHLSTVRYEQIVVTAIELKISKLRSF